MAVLKEVYDLSNNTKFGGWCVKSRNKIADTLDLSRASVINHLNTLELKGYIDYDKETGRCRPTEMIRELAQERENIGIMIKTDGYETISLKIKEMIEAYPNKVKQANDGCQKIRQGVSKNLTGGVKNLDTMSISLSISNKNIYAQAQNTLQVDICFDDFWGIYSGISTEDNIARKKKAVAEWKKLNNDERLQAISYARKLKEMGRPASYVPAPDKLLRLKEFENEPHKHVQTKGGGVASQNKYGLTEDENKHFNSMPIQDVIACIEKNDFKKIQSYPRYEIACKKIGRVPIHRDHFYALLA